MVSIEEQVGKLLEQVRFFRRSNEYTEAWMRLREAYDLCPSDSDDLLGRLHAMEGQLYRDDGQLQKATILYQKALTHFQSEKRSLKQAHTLRHLAEMEDELGHVDIAQNYLEQCQSIYAGLPQTSPMDLANFYRVYALFLEKNQATEPKAHALWVQARDIYSEYGIEEGVKECDDHLNS
ncbi:MAG: tetratricopeptide repeat protein [Cytophagales bacterium]|nr:tetratricopeptide repeat protein [Cytophagales bacterium]